MMFNIVSLTDRALNKVREGSDSNEFEKVSFKMAINSDPLVRASGSPLKPYVSVLLKAR